MKTGRDLKEILLQHLKINGLFSTAVNQEVLESVLHEKEIKEVKIAEIVAYQMNGFTLFLSDSGLHPRQVCFVDLKNGRSFIHDVEF